MKRSIAAIILTTLAFACIAHANPKLEKRVAELEKEMAELKAAIEPVMQKAKAEQLVAQHRNDARSRMRKDSELYSRDELTEIESLYQVANKKWGSQEGKDSLKKLITKYSKANRTGCALLYLGQMSKGKARVDYLEQAIADFGDCYYGDGVQVGAYARYYLAYHYKESGNKKKAAALCKEMSKMYPTAIDHSGKLLSTMIEK